VKITTLFSFSFILLLASNALWAGEAFLSKFDFEKPIYAGIGVTKNEVTMLKGEKIEGSMITRISGDKSDLGNQLLLGMHYSEHLDIETRLQNLGSFTQKTQIVDTEELSQTNINTVLNYQSLSFLMRPKYGLGKHFNLEAEAGVSYVMLDRADKVSVFANKSAAEIKQLTDDAKADLDTGNVNKLSLTYGISILYKGNGFFDWRGAIDRHQHSDEDFSTQSLSIIRRFDGK